MQPAGIGPGTLRVLAHRAPEFLAELLTPGKVFEAEVVSVFGDRAMLSLGRNLRLEATLQAALKEGTLIKVQVQPQDQLAGIVEGRGSVILKIVESLPALAAPPLAVLEATAPAGQSQQSAQAQLFWLPIPLPQGGQAWAQIHVQDDPKRGDRHGGRQIHQVRIWWETPGLGPVQVNMDGADDSLTALFTVIATDSRTAVESAFSDLQARLAVTGFSETRLGARVAAPGESVQPQRPAEPGRLDCWA